MDSLLSLLDILDGKLWVVAGKVALHMDTFYYFQHRCIRIGCPCTAASS